MSVLKSVDLNNVIRSQHWLLLVSLSLVDWLSVFWLNLPEGVTRSSRVQESLKADLTRPCLGYVLSKNDSFGARAKNDIDDVLGVSQLW